MIIVNLENFNQYEQLSNNFKTAIEFLRDTDLSSLPMGWTKIDGDNVKAIVSTYDTVSANDKEYESHVSYADIMMMIHGKETILCADKDHLEVTEVLLPEKDRISYKGQAETTVLLAENAAVVFFPQDAHKPGIETNDGSEKVSKICVKVKL